MIKLNARVYFYLFFSLLLFALIAGPVSLSSEQNSLSECTLLLVSGHDYMLCVSSIFVTIIWRGNDPLNRTVHTYIHKYMYIPWYIHTCTYIHTYMQPY